MAHYGIHVLLCDVLQRLALRQDTSDFLMVLLTGTFLGE